MDLSTPPPPLLSTATTTTATTTISPPETITQQPQSHSPPSSTSSTSSIIIVIIVIASAIIVSASIYLFLRFLSRRCSSNRSANDVVSSNEQNLTENEEGTHHHVICIDDNNGGLELSLPLFTFSSLTGNIAGGDCAVCLSKFEAVDQLRLLPLCCHAFHMECIDAWLKSNQTCPLCRSTVNPTENDVLNKIISISDSGNRNNNNNNNNNDSFRIEIGSISRGRRTPSDSGRRSYSIGSYDYVLEDGYEVPIESTTHRREISVDKEDSEQLPPVENNLTAEIGSGRMNWLREYVDRVSVSISSRSMSFRGGGSGRFFTGSSRRSEMVVDDFEATTHGSRVGEEISELFRWLSGV